MKRKIFKDVLVTTGATVEVTTPRTTRRGLYMAYLENPGTFTQKLRQANTHATFLQIASTHA